ncbi:hypothetical protein [Streptomyces parvulus]|uniref:hypothetical protein n=1 Tax=Streptomyces parvulus TaxID=146923 RepID=UPI0036EEB757
MPNGLFHEFENVRGHSFLYGGGHNDKSEQNRRVNETLFFPFGVGIVQRINAMWTGVTATATQA